MIKFSVLGKPVAKGRPRFRVRGKYVQTYTDENTTSFENLVKLEYENQCDCKYDKDDPLIVSIIFYLPIPESASKKKKGQMLNCEILPTKKPDLDNAVKSILDGLNGIAYYDDKQIVKIVTAKLYSENPKTDIEICSFSEYAQMRGVK